MDVKPIVGYTLYPSKYAPKLTTWLGGRTMPADFDPLAVDGRSRPTRTGLQIVASMNVFSEGHRDVKYGPGYTHPEWQTTLYEPALSVMSNAPGAAPYGLSDRANLPPRTPDLLSVYTDSGNLKAAAGDRRGPAERRRARGRAGGRRGPGGHLGQCPARRQRPGRRRAGGRLAAALRPGRRTGLDAHQLDLRPDQRPARSSRCR